MIPPGQPLGSSAADVLLKCDVCTNVMCVIGTT
jgi:hypothetical protein